MMFDPKTGKVLDREALESLQYQPSGSKKPRQRVAPDGTKRTEVLNQADGSLAGLQTSHSSGRVDAEVFPRSPSSGGSIH